MSKPDPQTTGDIVARLRTFESDEPCLADQLKMEDAAKEIEQLRAFVEWVHLYTNDPDISAEAAKHLETESEEKAD